MVQKPFQRPSNIYYILYINLYIYIMMRVIYKGVSSRGGMIEGVSRSTCISLSQTKEICPPPFFFILLFFTDWLATDLSATFVVKHFFVRN